MGEVRKRVVVYSERYGVFLGSCLGLAFWSRLDPAGQNMAVTFRDADHYAEWRREADGEAFEGCRLVEVEVASGDGYATIQECVAAGLPAWDPGEGAPR